MSRCATILIACASLFLAVDAWAQCADSDGNIVAQEGEVNPENTCELCQNGTFVDLPPPTRCDDMPGFYCDEEGVHLWQCVAVDDQGNTECKKERRADECPGGYVCGNDGLCAQQCAGMDDCQDGYECVDETCRRIVDPPDMGGVSDIGTDGGGGDVGPSDGEDMSTGRGDAGGPGTGGTNGGGGDNPEKGSCCAVIRPASGAQGVVFVLLLLGLIVRRHRTP